jgi:predicted nucleic-acid-binding Zn-ribbon protein
MGLFKKAEPQQVLILESPLRCQICQHDRFFQREGKIQTTGMTLFDLDWLNKSANCVVCAQCGYVHWFLPAG